MTPYKHTVYAADIMTATKPKKIKPDNGYFEVWERPCGHTYRVQTESFQTAIKRRGDASIIRFLRDRAAKGTCSTCSAQAYVVGEPVSS